MLLIVPNGAGWGGGGWEIVDFPHPAVCSSLPHTAAAHALEDSLPEWGEDYAVDVNEIGTLPFSCTCGSTIDQTNCCLFEPQSTLQDGIYCVLLHVPKGK